MNPGNVSLSNYGRLLLAEAQQRQKLQMGFEADIRMARATELVPEAPGKRPAPGRKPALTEGQRQEIVRLNREGKLSFRQLAHQYAVSRMTICRTIAEACGGQKTHNSQGGTGR